MGYYHEPYEYQYRRREPPIFDGFTLRPLPYSVLLILFVISLFLGIKFYSSCEEAAETVGFRINWLLLITPLVLIFAVKWLSSIPDPGYYFGFTSNDRRKLAYYGKPGCSSGGASPWGVAALIVLLLVLVRFQSTFLDSWF